MRSIIMFFLLVIFACNGYPDVEIYDMVPPDNPNGTDKDLGICYGSSTNWGAYSYTAALRYQNTGSACCSASIIQTSPVGILVTAAHCDGCIGSVMIGCSNPSTCTGATSYTIADCSSQSNCDGFIQNEDYNPSMISSDIAVVRLTTPITRAGAQEIKIAQVEQSIGVTRVTGYGITQTGGIPSQLQTMQSNKIERTECNDIMKAALGGNADRIDNTMVCIRGGNAGQDLQPTMCSGDSGGPMTSGEGDNQVLYGVNSWVLQGSGPGCSGCNCCSGYPQVGADVATFYDWINQRVSEINQDYYDSLNKTKTV